MAYCRALGVPFGINVESVSIRQVEIEASVRLAHCFEHNCELDRLDPFCLGGRIPAATSSVAPSAASRALGAALRLGAALWLRRGSRHSAR